MLSVLVVYIFVHYLIMACGYDGSMGGCCVCKNEVVYDSMVGVVCWVFCAVCCGL